MILVVIYLFSISTERLETGFFRSMENLNIPEVEPPPASPDGINFTVHLESDLIDFGFRVIGGQEEGTQVRGWVGGGEWEGKRDQVQYRPWSQGRPLNYF